MKKPKYRQKQKQERKMKLMFVRWKEFPLFVAGANRNRSTAILSVNVSTSAVS